MEMKLPPISAYLRRRVGVGGALVALSHEYSEVEEKKTHFLKNLLKRV